MLDMKELLKIMIEMEMVPIMIPMDRNMFVSGLIIMHMVIV